MVGVLLTLHSTARPNDQAGNRHTGPRLAMSVSPTRQCSLRGYRPVTLIASTEYGGIVTVASALAPLAVSANAVPFMSVVAE